nr:hypothetical protein [Tanacetum cinerariifolium]
MRVRGYASWVCEAGAHGKSGKGYGTVPVGEGVRGSSLGTNGAHEFWAGKWVRGFVRHMIEFGEITGLVLGV